MLQKENECHIFTWCVCHSYNLFVEDGISAAKIVSEIVESIHDFGAFLRLSSKRMTEWKRVTTELANLYHDINKRMRPGQVNMTRWFSKRNTIASAFKSESCFLAMLITLHNILNADKCLYKLSDDQNKALSKIYKLWNQPETVIFGYILLTIFDKLQNNMSYLQTSGLAIIDAYICNAYKIVPCIYRS